jgi:hypothetical protein
MVGHYRRFHGMEAHASPSLLDSSADSLLNREDGKERRAAPLFPPVFLPQIALMTQIRRRESV